MLTKGTVVTKPYRPLCQHLIVRIALAVLCCLVLWMPQQAVAYYDRGTVGIGVGSSSVSVRAGSSTSVSVSLAPAQDGQTQGCGMAECPQTCPPECVDANGQCTCAGPAYSTYYTSVAVSSSNGGVATASYTGGAVQIYGVGAGSATITLSASLRQFSTSTATIAVTVSDPSASLGGSTSTSNTTTGGSSSGGGGASGAGAVTASPTELAQAAAAGGQGQEGAAPEDTVVEMHGVRAHLTHITTAAAAATKLKEVAGTAEQVTFWYGGTVERPDYSWTFYGQDFDGAALAALDALDGLDLTIAVSERGNGLVAALLSGTGKALVLDFAFEGVLPAPATLYIAAPASMAPGDALALYRYDEQGNAFAHVLDGLSVESGYIAFETDHCSVWAISAEDLVALSDAAVPAAAPGEAAGAGATGAVAAVAGFLSENLVAVLVAAGVLLALVVALVLLGASRRRKAYAAAGAAGAIASEGAAEAPADSASARPAPLTDGADARE